MSTDKKNPKQPVVVKLRNADAEVAQGLHLYVFNKQGELLENHSIAKGEVKLKTDAERIEGQVHMVVGPELPKEIDKATLNPVAIQKMGGFQPSVRLVGSDIIIDVPKIKFPPFDWCLITGSVTKTFNVDGQAKVLPICDARVHICEVDRVRWRWPYVPVHVVDDLAIKLRKIVEQRDPVPHPIGPDPGPGPIGPIDDLNVRMRTRQMQHASSVTVPPQSTRSLPALPVHVQNGLFSGSAITVRDTIYNHFHLLHPYLCLWPWFWPYFYHCHEIATVYTDCDGRFDFNYLNLFHDKDIYVWVEVCVDGQWVTVYRPSVPCHTRWNYACGSDIHVHVTDPRVMPCSCGLHLQGEVVWFRSIGESATALHIEQDDAHAVNVQGVNVRNVGCTDVTDALRIAPFGSTLRFKLLFGDGLPKSGITHYRWRKTKIKDSALNNVPFETTSVVEGTVKKNYFVITTDEGGHMHFETREASLGAEGTGQDIGYRIPEWDIYADPGVPAADKALTIQWTSPDFWSATLDSNSLTDGLWRFDLELLRRDGAGSFHVVSVPKQVFQVSDFNDPGQSVDAPPAYLNLEPPTDARNLTVKARVDNARCHADIQDANLTNNGVTEYSGRCGFLHYTDVNQTTHISFRATHPRNFARFEFSVVKGNGMDNPGIGQSGYVISGVGDYTLSGGVFSRDVPVSQLLGSCPQAAFAENLVVYALATDGSRVLDEYNAPDTNAFALSNT